MTEIRINGFPGQSEPVEVVRMPPKEIDIIPLKKWEPEARYIEVESIEDADGDKHEIEGVELVIEMEPEFCCSLAEIGSVALALLMVLLTVAFCVVNYLICGPAPI